MVWLPDGEKFDDVFSHFDRILAWMDRQIDILQWHNPRYHVVKN